VESVSTYNDDATILFRFYQLYQKTEEGLYGFYFLIVHYFDNLWWMNNQGGSQDEQKAA
jgi:hypothetical protein